MIFKRQLSFFLAVTLLVSNIGLAFNVHYCKGKIASVSTVFSSGQACRMVIETSEKQCCAKASKNHKSCCDNKVVDFQDDGDQLVFKTFAFDVAITGGTLQHLESPITDPQFIKNTPCGYDFESNAPPLFKLYQKLLLYA